MARRMGAACPLSGGSGAGPQRPSLQRALIALYLRLRLISPESGCKSRSTAQRLARALLATAGPAMEDADLLNAMLDFEVRAPPWALQPGALRPCAVALRAHGAPGTSDLPQDDGENTITPIALPPPGAPPLFTAGPPGAVARGPPAACMRRVQVQPMLDWGWSPCPL